MPNWTAWSSRPKTRAERNDVPRLKASPGCQALPHKKRPADCRAIVIIFHCCGGMAGSARRASAIPRRCRLRAPLLSGLQVSRSTTSPCSEIKLRPFLPKASARLNYRQSVAARTATSFAGEQAIWLEQSIFLGTRAAWMISFAPLKKFYENAAALCNGSERQRPRVSGRRVPTRVRQSEPLTAGWRS